jgi:hypothetical protein
MFEVAPPRRIPTSDIGVIGPSGGQSVNFPECCSGDYNQEFSASASISKMILYHYRLIEDLPRLQGGKEKRPLCIDPNSMRWAHGINGEVVTSDFY